MMPLDELHEADLFKALAHPVRKRIIKALARRDASPKQLSDEFGVAIANVTYHARRLEEFGVIRLVDTARRRGAIEHYFRLETRPGLTDEAWEVAPPSIPGWLRVDGHGPPLSRGPRTRGTAPVSSTTGLASGGDRTRNPSQTMEPAARQRKRLTSRRSVARPRARA